MGHCGMLEGVNVLGSASEMFAGVILKPCSFLKHFFRHEFWLFGALQTACMSVAYVSQSILLSVSLGPNPEVC